MHARGTPVGPGRSLAYSTGRLRAETRHGGAARAGPAERRAPSSPGPPATGWVGNKRHSPLAGVEPASAGAAPLPGAGPSVHPCVWGRGPVVVRNSLISNQPQCEPLPSERGPGPPGLREGREGSPRPSRRAHGRRSPHDRKRVIPATGYSIILVFHSPLKRLLSFVGQRA